MDAKEQLRKYLEQKLETGETELLLESMPAAEALKGLSGRGQRTRVPAEPAKSLRDAAPESGDWRETLKPPTVNKRYEFPRPADVQEIESKPASVPGFEKGMVAGAKRSELFDEVVGNLETLEAVAEKVSECTRCPLYATATNHVPGEGNPKAQLVVVGEAPGEREDSLGRPFVGPSGELLTKILAAIDLAREDVFICNVLKHRPPGNRNPRPEEVEACSPYLIKQLELIQPKVIVAFGTFAAQTLLDTKTPIGKLRGLVHRYHGIPLVVTYHPAALLRNPAWKRPTWDDVKLARRILDSPTRA